MKLYELSAKINEIPQTYGKYASPFKLAVIAFYLDNHDQKSYRHLEERVTKYQPDALMQYGIQMYGVPHSSVLERKYLLFLDDKSVFENEDILRDFCKKYEDKFLPEGSCPSEFLFAFAIDRYEEYRLYIDMIISVYPNILPFITFSSLILSKGVDDQVSEERSLLGSKYNVVEFNEVSYQQINGFFTDSTISESSHLKTLMKNLDTYAKEIPAGSILHNVYNPRDFLVSQRHCLSLAFLNYKYGLLYYTSNLETALRINQYLSVMYFPYEIYSLYDRLMMYREYPTFGIIARELSDYILYFTDDNRKLCGTVSYLDGDTLHVDEVDFSTEEISSLFHLGDVQEKILKLEEKKNWETFMHIGNTICLNRNGEKKLAYVESFKFKLPTYCFPLNTSIAPFAREMSHNDIMGVMPLHNIAFMEDSTGQTPLSKTLKTLTKLLASRGSSKVVVKNDLYIADYHRTGEAILYFFLETFAKMPMYYDTDLDQQIVGLYRMFNVRFRNHLAEDLIKDIPLERLRYRSDFLTLFGTNGDKLTLKGDFFKTK